MAVLIVLGGGRTVIPMLMAFDLFGSKTVISFLTPSCFCKGDPHGEDKDNAVPN